MKIDCPHCGVHGSVDDSLARKKLRCPKCSKVFLVTDDMVPEGGDNDLVRQELLNDPPHVPVTDEPADLSDDSSVAAAEQALEDELDTVDTEAASEEESSDEEPDTDITDDEMFDPMPVQEVPEESVENAVDGEEDESETPMDTCSACGESFASAFLVEVDSQLYCALCQPEEEEADDEETAGDVEDVNDVEEDEQEQESGIDDEDFLGFSSEEEEAVEAADEEGEPEEVAEELVACAGCGESLHPQFLDSHDGKQYCALCFPDDEEESKYSDDSDEVAEDEQEHTASDELDGDTEAGDAVLDEDDQDEEEASEENVDDAEELEDSEEETEEETTQEGADDEHYEDEEGEFPKVPCSVCGETFHKDFLQEIDSKHYCGVCQPEVIETIPMEDVAGVTAVAAGHAESDDSQKTQDVQGQGADFTIGDLMREAWQKTKGAKGAIWGGTLVMYLIIFGLSFGGVFATQDMMRSDPATATSVNMGLQLVTSWLSMILGGGLMLIGVRRALEKRVRWKMIFAAFSKKKVISMTIASILQVILICIAFLLLVLPGIYLSVGYALTLPLILDKGLGPWEALETSRKAIHTRWWSVLGAYFVMVLLYLVSAIPFGLGVIWTMPMFMVLIGVIYARFFGPSADQAAEEGEATAEEEEEAETDSEEEEAVEELAEESEAKA